MPGYHWYQVSPGLTQALDDQVSSLQTQINSLGTGADYSNIKPPTSSGVAYWTDFKTYQSGIDNTLVNDFQTLLNWATTNSYTTVVIPPWTTIYINQMTATSLTGIGGNLNTNQIAFVGYPGQMRNTIIKVKDNIAPPLTMAPILTVDPNATGGTWTISVYDGATLKATTSGIGWSASNTTIQTALQAAFTAAGLPSAYNNQLQVNSNGQYYLPQDRLTWSLQTDGTGLAGTNLRQTKLFNTTSGSSTVTDASGTLTASDNGRLITGAGIPTGSGPVYITAYNSTNHTFKLNLSPTNTSGHGISATATASNVSMTVGGGVSVENFNATIPWQALVSTRSTSTQELRFANLTIDFNGLNQTNNFQGLRVSGNPWIHDVLFLGNKGSNNTPPNETCVLRLYSNGGSQLIYGGLIEDVEIDGQGVSALGSGIVIAQNTSASSPIRYTRVKSHHNGYSHGLGNYKSQYIEYLNCEAWMNGVGGTTDGYGFNNEDPSGPITHISCKSWHNTAGYRYNVDDASANRTDITASGNTGWGNTYGHIYDGTWGNVFNDNRLPNSVTGSSTADRLDNTVQKSTVTITSGNSSLSFASAHGYSVGDGVNFSTVTATGFSTNTPYFVVSVPDSTHVTLATSPNGVAISPGSSGTATVSTVPVNAFSGENAQWMNNSMVAAYRRYLLPTGGFGYVTANRTTRASFDSTEKAAWTYLPGGHYELITSGTAYTLPNNISNARFRLIGGGGGGGGGGCDGTSTPVNTQVGGGGGGAGQVLSFNAAVVGGTTYTIAIGTGGTGGTGAAAGGTAGAAGGAATAGGNTTIAINGVTYTATGGAKGAVGAAKSSSTVGGGLYAQGSTGVTTTNGIPGAGGPATSTTGTQAIPVDIVVGGGGGMASSSTLGGNGGGARTTVAGGLVASVTSQTASTVGGNGTSAGTSCWGCGGGGGGGGAQAASGNAGGTGGNGQQGVIEIWY